MKTLFGGLVLTATHLGLLLIGVFLGGFAVANNDQACKEMRELFELI